MSNVIQITSNNFNGQYADITFYPCSGGSINLGYQLLPYDYAQDNYEGTYDIYISAYTQTCQLVISCPSPTPTPSITPTLTPSPVAWTPASFNNLWDWWRADTNVSGYPLSTSWTGYNGNILSKVYSPFIEITYSGSNPSFNNEPSVNFNPFNNPNDVLFSVPLPPDNTSKTAIVIGKLITLNSGDNALVALGEGNFPRMAIFGASSSLYLNYVNDGVGSGDIVTYNGSDFVNNTYQIIRISYDRTSGNVNYYAKNQLSGLTTPIKTDIVASGVNFVNGNFNPLSYGGAYGTTPNMEVVEIIFINGIPSAGEITNLQTYLNTRYGLI